MKVEISEIPVATPGSHPLLTSPQYAANLAGSSIFFQVMSGIDEHPVRVILHDKWSGERMQLVIQREGDFKPIGSPPEKLPKLAAVSTVKPASLIQRVDVPAMAPPAPQVLPPPVPRVAPSPAVSPSPAQKLVPPGGAPAVRTPAPSSPSPSPKLAVPPSIPKIVSVSGAPSPRISVKK